MPTSLHIGQSVLESLLAHAGCDYPDECCGILVGRAGGPDVYVDRAIPANNIAEGDRATSYQLDWRTLFSSVRSARTSPGHGQMVGFYHSHPDGSAEPSQRDRQAAWPDYSYLIVSMSDGRCTAVTSWRIPGEGKAFQPEPIVREGDVGETC